MFREGCQRSQEQLECADRVPLTISPEKRPKKHKKEEIQVPSTTALESRQTMRLCYGLAALSQGDRLVPWLKATGIATRRYRSEGSVLWCLPQRLARDSRQ